MEGDRTKTSWLNAYPELIERNFFIVVNDIDSEVCRHVGCSKETLESKVSYAQRNGGTTSSIDLGEYSNAVEATSTRWEGCLARLSLSRLPKFRLLCDHHALYCDKEWAKISLLLHVLLSFPESTHNQSSHRILTAARGKQGFLLLVKPTENSHYCFASAVIFADVDDTKRILASYLDPYGFPSDPFVVGELLEE